MGPAWSLSEASWPFLSEVLIWHLEWKNQKGESAGPLLGSLGEGALDLLGKVPSYCYLTVRSVAGQGWLGLKVLMGLSYQHWWWRQPAGHRLSGFLWLMFSRIWTHF